MNAYIKTEIENIPTIGKETLYVVGLNDAEGIIRMATRFDCNVIRFGAKRSFDIDLDDDYNEWKPWSEMISEVMKDSFNMSCVFEFDLKYAESFLETGLAENFKMIPVISVQLPYNNQLGYNAVIKLDDISDGRSNEGIWCHSLHDLKTRKAFTPWPKKIV